MGKNNAFNSNRTELMSNRAIGSTSNHSKIVSFFLRLFEFVDKNANRVLLFYVLAVVISILFALRQGDDIAFHLQRLDAIIQEIQHFGLSAFPIRIYHATAYGYGYASPLFYGDIFMWPYAALAALLNLTVVSAYKIMLACTFVITWLLARFSFGLVFGQHQKDIAVFLYMVSVTIFGDATNSCVGRDFATMFVPLCICSFFCLLYEREGGQWKCGILLSLGMTGLLYSNLLDAVIVAFTLLWILVFSFHKITVHKIFILVLAAIFCIGLSAWFLCPMIEQMISQTFFVTSKEVNQGMNDLHKWTMPFFGILFPARIATALCKILGIEANFSWAYFYGMLFYLVLVAILIFKRHQAFSKKDEVSRFYVGITILLLVYMIFQTKLFPHHIFSKIIGTMQFPWRVAIVMTCIGCLLAVRVLQTTRNNLLVSLLMTLSACLVLVSCVSSYGYSLALSVVRDVPYADYSYSSDSLGAGEYLPLEFLDDTDRYVWKEKLQSRGSIVSCDNPDVIFTFEKAFDHVSIDYSHNTDTANFELPLIYYKGYVAKDIDCGENLIVNKNSSGLVCVEAKRNAGKIVVTYDGTDVQTVSEWVSLSFAIILLGSVIFVQYRRKQVTQ